MYWDNVNTYYLYLKCNISSKLLILIAAAAKSVYIQTINLYPNIFVII